MTGVFGRDRINSNLGDSGAHGSFSLAEAVAKLGQVVRRFGDGLSQAVTAVSRLWLQLLETSGASWSRVNLAYCASARDGIGLSGDRLAVNLSGRTAASPARIRQMSQSAYVVLNTMLRGLMNWRRGDTLGRRGTC